MSRRDAPPIPPSTVSPTVWATASATARGSSHVRSGLPNQDAALRRDVPEVAAVVAALADGHGGARYVRSDIGAMLAVSIATELGARFAVERGDDRERTIQRHAATELVPQIVDRWVEAVGAHVADHPFTDEERTRAGVDLDEDVAYAYGATLLFAIATPAWVLVGQLGDGDVIAVDRANTVTRPVPRDSRLVAGQTTSLCLPDASRDVRLTVLTAEAGLETLLLASDGYGNSFAGAEWWVAVGQDVQAQVREHGLASVGASLPDWVADSAEVGGDDVTVAVLARALATMPANTRPANTGPPATVPVPTVAPTVPRARRSRGRLVALLLVLASLAAAAGVLVLVLADGDDDDDVTSNPTTTAAIARPEATTTTPGALGDRASLRITSPIEPHTWVGASPFVLTGEVDPESTVTITLVSSGSEPIPVAIGDDGSWSQSIDLVEWENLVEITVTDRRPELDPRTEPRTIVFDPNRPVVVIDSPATGSTHAGNVVIRGHAEPFSEIFVGDDKVADTGMGDTWTFTYAVTRDLTLRIHGRDRVGAGPEATLALRFRSTATTRPTPPTADPAPTTTTTAAPPTTPASGGAAAPQGATANRPTDVNNPVEEAR